MNAIVILCDTLRRDHCAPYHHGQSLDQVGGRDQPNWVVPTPNLDRLARIGTVFDHCYAGSTPCMPARRDLYTGCYEFLRRGMFDSQGYDVEGWTSHSAAFTGTWNSVRSSLGVAGCWRCIRLCHLLASLQKTRHAMRKPTDIY